MVPQLNAQTQEVAILHLDTRRSSGRSLPGSHRVRGVDGSRALLLTCGFSLTGAAGRRLSQILRGCYLPMHGPQFKPGLKLNSANVSHHSPCVAPESAKTNPPALRFELPGSWHRVEQIGGPLFRPRDPLFVGPQLWEMKYRHNSLS